MSTYLASQSSDFFYAVEARDSECVAEMNTVAYQAKQLITNADNLSVCDGTDFALDLNFQDDFVDFVLLDENGEVVEPVGQDLYVLDPSQSYFLSATDVNGCVTTRTFEVSVFPTPSLMIENQTEATTSGGGSIELSVTGGTGPFNYILGPDNNDTGIFEDLPPADYEVIVEDANGCTSTISFTIMMQSSVEDIELNSQILIYPNPTSTNLFVELINGQNMEALNIYHSDGRLVRTNNQLGNSHEIDLSDLESGVYFISIMSESKLGFKRFVKI